MSFLQKTTSRSKNPGNHKGAEHTTRRDTGSNERKVEALGPSASKLVNDSVSQPAGERVSQSVSQLISQFTSQSVFQPVSWSVSQPLS